MSEFMDKLRARAAADDARHEAELRKILARPVPRKSKSKLGASPSPEPLEDAVSPEATAQKETKSSSKSSVR